MTTATAHHEAHSEKQHAALSSLFWALFLTLIKLGAGLATNSLGILSEALHSSLDLVAAGITLSFAVRGPPARTPAGTKTPSPTANGKIENLSALAETVLLLVTCGWIVHEAVNRLFFDAPKSPRHGGAWASSSFPCSWTSTGQPCSAASPKSTRAKP